MLKMGITHAALVLSIACAACGQGGRELPGASTRDASSSAPEDAEPGQPLLLDPVAELLEPTGLGYRVDTTLGEGPDAVHQTAYGVDGLSVMIDVDGNEGTGNLLGADISVHFFTLLLYARMQVDLIGDTPEGIPLKVEVRVLDPRNLLGLPGLFGVVDPDLRVALSMDAREGGAPSQFSSTLSILDSLFEFLPRFTSAQLDIQSEGAGEALGAGVAMFADRSGERADNLDLELHWRPAVSESTVDVLMAPDAEESALTLGVSAPTAMTVEVRSGDGLVSMPSAQRDIQVGLDTLVDQFDLQLFGVDGFEDITGQDSRYQINATEPVQRLSLDIRDWEPGDERLTRAVVQPLPQTVVIVRTPSGGLQLDAGAEIGDIAYAQSRNAPLVWRPEANPDEPFRSHLLTISERDDGTEVLQARLAGLRALQAEFEPDLSIDGQLRAAPLEFRAEDERGFTDARLERLPGRFSVRFPEDDEQLRFSYEADAASPALHYERQETDMSTIASIQPLPATFTLCASGDASCGSHGESTDASIAFSASETMRVNYHQRSADGRKEIAITDLVMQHLEVDAGTQQGAKRGYVYFDTQGTGFYGSLLQRDGSSGLYLSFSEGTHAVERKVRYKNFIQVDQRIGSMQCPGKESLEVRSGGSWYDLDFLLDQLCQ